jgi:succinylglutamic semialdehyde dehydrogenase
MAGRQRPELVTIDPSTGRQTWTSKESTADDVARAVQAARAAFEDWALRPLEQRIAICQRFRDLLKEHNEELAAIIAEEVGKPLWEARTEVTTMANKVDISVQSYGARTGETAARSPTAMPCCATVRTACSPCSARTTSPATCRTATSCRP